MSRNHVLGEKTQTVNQSIHTQIPAGEREHLTETLGPIMGNGDQEERRDQEANGPDQPTHILVSDDEQLLQRCH